MTANSHSVTKKLPLDLYYIQMKWTLWYIPIVFIIFFVLDRFIPDIREHNLNFMASLFQPSKIYMLVIGIMTSLVFLSYFVKNGVTRKDYFTGASIAAAGLALSIIIISAVVDGILILTGLSETFSIDSAHAAFLDTTSVLIVPVAVFSLILLLYYVMGWIIAIGFQRFGGWGGMGFIVVALMFMALIDLLWEADFSHPAIAFLNIPFPDFSVPVSIVGTIILIAFGLWIIRAATRRIPIKPE